MIWVVAEANRGSFALLRMAAWNRNGNGNRRSFDLAQDDNDLGNRGGELRGSFALLRMAAWNRERQQQPQVLRLRLG